MLGPVLCSPRVGNGRRTAQITSTGVALIPASSAKTIRHRLNRGGDRDANRALHLLAVRRMAWDPRTRAYVARRTAEGRSKPEILRCLKRYLAREVYPLLAGRLAAAAPLPPPSAAYAGQARRPSASDDVIAPVSLDRL